MKPIIIPILQIRKLRNRLLELFTVNLVTGEKKTPHTHIS